MTNLIAFHGEQKLKDMMIEELYKHQKADQIIKGTYGEIEEGQWKGCAVGCSIKSLNIRLKKKYSTSDHGIYEKVLGIPKILARLEDGIFEGLDIKEAKKFPLKFIKAIPVGADLSGIWDKYAYWLLINKKWGVLQFAKTDEVKKSIQDTANFYKRKIQGEIINQSEWNKVYLHASSAFYAYAYASAFSASASASAYAAYASAYAAYASASAYAAYASASAYALRSAQAKKLLNLLKAAK